MVPSTGILQSLDILFSWEVWVSSRRAVVIWLWGVFLLYPGYYVYLILCRKFAYIISSYFVSNDAGGYLVTGRDFYGDSISVTFSVIVSISSIF